MVKCSEGGEGLFNYHMHVITKVAPLKVWRIKMLVGSTIPIK